MPTVLRIGPYRFHFYSADGSEPPHIHVRRDQTEAKYWLNPVRLADRGGMPESELRRVSRLVTDHEQQLIDGWNAFFNIVDD
jgi:hypothetical protein